MIDMWCFTYISPWHHLAINLFSGVQGSELYVMEYFTDGAMYSLIYFFDIRTVHVILRQQSVDFTKVVVVGEIGHVCNNPFDFLLFFLCSQYRRHKHTTWKKWCMKISSENIYIFFIIDAHTGAMNQHWFHELQQWEHVCIHNLILKTFFLVAGLALIYHHPKQIDLSIPPVLPSVTIPFIQFVSVVHFFSFLIGPA